VAINKVKRKETDVFGCVENQQKQRGKIMQVYEGIEHINIFKVVNTGILNTGFGKVIVDEEMDDRAVPIMFTK
jgi:hypothetical protein